MSNYRLYDKQGSETFWRIYNARKWVGRIAQHADGTYIGVIGKEMVRGCATRHEAFEEVVARRLGFNNAAALHAHNARVSRANAATRNESRYIAAEILNGNFKPFDDALERMLKTNRS